MSVSLPSSSVAPLPPSSPPAFFPSPSFQQVGCEGGLKEGVGDTRTGERSGGLKVLEVCLAVEEWRRMVSRLPKPTCAREKETESLVSEQQPTTHVLHHSATQGPGMLENMGENVSKGPGGAGETRSGHARCVSAHQLNSLCFVSPPRPLQHLVAGHSPWP